MNRSFSVLASLLLLSVFANETSAWYHAPLGRWVSRDPIGYRAGTANLYEYVDSIPTYFVDPLGFGSWNISPIQVPIKGGNKTRPGYRDTYKPDKGECYCGRIKLVQAFMRPNDGVGPQFDIGPKGNVRPRPWKPGAARYPGYVDTGYLGGFDDNGNPYIDDAPSGPRDVTFIATVCAVCEESVPNGAKEIVLSCVNFIFYNIQNSKNDPRDGNIYPFRNGTDPNPLPPPVPPGGVDLPGDDPGPPWQQAPDPRPIGPPPYDPTEPVVH